MIHTKMPRNCTVFLIRRDLQGTPFCELIKWLTMLVRKVNGKPRNFKAYSCGSSTSFKLYAFQNRRFQSLFMDQLVRSKATCPFKLGLQTKGFLYSINILLNELRHTCCIHVYIPTKLW